ncbi:MAG: type II toxin-antitoxin system prevent-host-death family antitoxin [Armatimonadota bacterium]
MITMNATECKAKFLQLIEEVSASGEPVTVTKHGKRLVTIIPSVCEDKPRAKAGFMKDQVTILGDIMEPFTEEWEQVDTWF